jgi:TP901 family phage tail tape measure protein
MAFNINAQVILSGPKNIRAITQTIRQQLGNINANVNLNLPKGAKQQLTQISNATKTLSKNTSRLNTNAMTAGKSVRTLGNNTKQAANAMQILGKETALTFKRFAAAGIVTGTVFRLTQAISEGVSKALEFERGLVKLSQITGRTTGNLNSLKKAVNDLATGLGKDANELLEISQIFAQTGQSINQIKSSITAVARSSLAPTFGEMKQTAEGLVAALNQFGISASQSEAILGSLNRVSKKFAVESDDLIAAIRRAGGVFALSAGEVEKPIDALNQFIGVFTAVRSTTRESAETVATGLRTIFSRIQRRGTIDTLKQLGINLTDANGKFVGLFQSFRILSSELDKIVQKGDAVTLSAITEQLGGIRQIGKLLPAIRNFRKAEAAFAEAQAGAVEGLGSDVEKGLTPLIKTFEQVSARFGKLIRTISESATFQAVAKSLAGLANAFLSVSETLVPLLPLMLKFATIKLAKGAIGFAQGFASSFGGVGRVGSAVGGAISGTGSSTVAKQASATSLLSGTVKQLAAALVPNTKALSGNTTAVIANNIAINSLLRRLSVPSIGSGRRGFASGGLVPGTGNRDTVPAMLTPGEFVIRKSATQAFGAGNLAGINKYASGGVVGSVTSPFNMSVLNGLSGSSRFSARGASVRSIANEGSSARIELEKAFRRDVSKGGANLDSELAELRALRVAGSATGGANPLKSNQYSGLRSRIANKVKGRGNVKRLKNFKSTDQAIAFVEGADLETAGINSLMQGASLIAPRGIATGVNPDFRDKFGDILMQRVPQLLAQGLGEMGKTLATLPQPLTRLLDRGALGSVEGQLFEGFTRLATQNFLTDELRDTTSPLFDVQGGNLARYKELFGTLFSFPSEIKNNFAQDKIDSTFGKAVKTFKSQSIRFNPAMVEKFSLFASGGMASGTDTVPALLTPGEFVVNRNSAKSFGYGNLKNINKYAKGGRVQGFKNGGAVKGGMGGGGAMMGALLLPDLLFTIPMLTEAMKQSAEGVEGAGSQLTFALISLATTAAFLAPSLAGLGKSVGGLKGLLLGKVGARRFETARGLGLNRRQALGQALVRRGGPKRGAGSLRGGARALAGLKGLGLSSLPLLGAAAAAGAAALVILNKSTKEVADNLRTRGLAQLTDAMKKAADSFKEIAENTSGLNLQLLEKANKNAAAAVKSFSGSIALSNQAASMEDSTTLGALLRGGRIASEMTGDLGRPAEERRRLDISRRAGRLGRNFRENFSGFDEEFAQGSSDAFSKVQEQFAEGIIERFTKVGGSSEDAARQITNVINQLDTLNAAGDIDYGLTVQSLKKLELQLLMSGKAGRAAAEQLGRDLQVQFISKVEETAARLGPAGDKLRGIIGQLLEQNPDAFSSVQGATGAIDAVSGFIRNNFDPETARILAAEFNKLSKEALATTVETAKSSQRIGIMNQAIKETSIFVDSTINTLKRFAAASKQLSGELNRVNSNLDKDVSEILSGQANFTLGEQANPLKNLDLFAANSAAQVEQAFSILGSAGDEATKGLLNGLKEAVTFGADFDKVITDVIKTTTQQSIDQGDQIINVDQVVQNFEKALGEEFSKSKVGKIFIDDFRASIQSKATAREGESIIPLDTLKATLENGSDLFERFSESGKTITETLADIIDSMREVEQATLQRLAQEFKIAKEIRSIDLKQLDLADRVRDIRGIGNVGRRDANIQQVVADLGKRIAILTGGETNPTAIGKAQGRIRGRITELQTKREGQPLNEDELTELAGLKDEFSRNTEALKLLAENTSALTAVQNKIAELQSKQDASRKGLVGLLGQLGEVQNRARAGDFKGAREQALDIRKTFATIQKLQKGIPLNLDEAAKVLGGEFDQLLLDLGANPEALKKAIDNGFKLGRGAAVGGLGQLGIQLPANAFENVNLGDQINDAKNEADRIAKLQNAAFEALKNNAKLASDAVNNSKTAADIMQKALRDTTVELLNFKRALQFNVNPNAPQPPPPKIKDIPKPPAGAAAQAVAAGGGGFQNIEPGKVRKSSAAINRGEQIKALTGGNVNRFKTLKEEEKVLEERLASERKSADEARANQTEINKANQARVARMRDSVKLSEDRFKLAQENLRKFDEENRAMRREKDLGSLIKEKGATGLDSLAEILDKETDEGSTLTGFDDSGTPRSGKEFIKKRQRGTGISGAFFKKGGSRVEQVGGLDMRGGLDLGNTDRTALLDDLRRTEAILEAHQEGLRKAEQKSLDDFLRPDEEKAEAKLAEMAAQRKAKLDASPSAQQFVSDRLAMMDFDPTVSAFDRGLHDDEELNAQLGRPAGGTPFQPIQGVSQAPKKRETEMERRMRFNKQRGGRPVGTVESQFGISNSKLRLADAIKRGEFEGTGLMTDEDGTGAARLEYDIPQSLAEDQGLIPQGKIRNFKGYDPKLGLLKKDSYLSSRLTNQEVSAAIEFRRQQDLAAGNIDPMSGALTDKGREARGFKSKEDILSATKERQLGKAQRINQARNMLRSGKLQKGQVQDYIKTGQMPKPAFGANAGPAAAGPAAAGPPAAGPAAAGGGVAGPDVAMNNLAQALNGVKDGFQINVGEINVTISNATELANSIKSMVVEAVKEGVGSVDLNNAPAGGDVVSQINGPPGAYA